MKKSLTILLILLLLVIGSYAQLSVNLIGTWPEQLNARLIVFDGIKAYQFNGQESETQKFFIEIPDSIHTGLFVMQLYDSLGVLYESRIVYNNDPIEIGLNFKDSELEVDWGSDHASRAYNEFIIRRDAMMNRLRVLRDLYAYYPDTNTVFYDKLNKELEQQKLDLTELYQQYTDGNEDSPIYPLIMASSIYIPSSSLSRRAQLDGMLEHYYNFYDPINEVIVRSPIYKDKLDEYIELVLQSASVDGEADEQMIIAALDLYLNNIKDDESLFEESLVYIWEFMYKKAMENVTEYLDVNYLVGSCVAENDEQLKERLLAYERLGAGSQAPDINWEDKNQERSLAQFRGKYTLLVFWASWCPHCTNTLSSVHKHYLNTENLNILAIGLDEDASSWNNASARYPTWTHLRAAQKWNSPIAKDYAIYATPTFFILDEDGKIVGKAKNLQEIQQYIPAGI